MPDGYSAFRIYPEAQSLEQNKSRVIGRKCLLFPNQAIAIRKRLELAGNLRDLAQFNVALDIKLC